MKVKVLPRQPIFRRKSMPDFICLTGDLPDPRPVLLVVFPPPYACRFNWWEMTYDGVLTVSGEIHLDTLTRAE